eukprot:1928640-Rhodomonas_salina.13
MGMGSGRGQASLKEHEEVTKIKNVNKIQMGKFIVQTWYFSPLPREVWKQVCPSPSPAGEKERKTRKKPRAIHRVPARTPLAPSPLFLPQTPPPTKNLQVCKRVCTFFLSFLVCPPPSSPRQTPNGAKR